MKSIPVDSWTKQHAEELYGIRNWSGDYFSISEKGEVIISAPMPASDECAQVSLVDVIAAMRERDLEMPVLLRIEKLEK